MLRCYDVRNDLILIGDSADAVVTKMWQYSHDLEADSIDDYMNGVKRRAFSCEGLDINTDNADDFVNRLIALGFLISIRGNSDNVRIIRFSTKCVEMVHRMALDANATMDKQYRVKGNRAKAPEGVVDQGCLLLTRSMIPTFVKAVADYIPVLPEEVVDFTDTEIRQLCRLKKTVVEKLQNELGDEDWPTIKYSL